MEPELMNCCKPEPTGAQGYGKMLNRIQVLEDGRVSAKEANIWRIEGQKRRITRKEYQRLVNKFEMEGFLYVAKRIVESFERKDPEGKRRAAKGRKVTLLESEKEERTVKNER